jgi:hypothetical protein
MDIEVQKGGYFGEDDFGRLQGFVRIKIKWLSSGHDADRLPAAHNARELCTSFLDDRDSRRGRSGLRIGRIEFQIF